MDNQPQEVVNPEVSKDVKTKSTEATENVLSPNVPYHRFSELTENYRELEEKFDGLVKEQETVREKKLQEEAPKEHEKLGFSPKFSLEEGLQKTIQSYVNGTG